MILTHGWGFSINMRKMKQTTKVKGNSKVQKNTDIDTSKDLTSDDYKKQRLRSLYDFEPATEELLKFCYQNSLLLLGFIGLNLYTDIVKNGIETILKVVGENGNVGIAIFVIIGIVLLFCIQPIYLFVKSWKAYRALKITQNLSSFNILVLAFPAIFDLIGMLCAFHLFIKNLHHCDETAGRFFSIIGACVLFTIIIILWAVGIYANKTYNLYKLCKKCKDK